MDISIAHLLSGRDNLRFRGSRSLFQRLRKLIWPLKVQEQLTKFALSDGKGILSIHPVTKFPAEAIALLGHCSDSNLRAYRSPSAHSEFDADVLAENWEGYGKALLSRRVGYRTNYSVSNSDSIN